MFKRVFLTIAKELLLLFAVFAICWAQGAQVTESFFGMHILHPDQTAWPRLSFGALRLWDSHTGWAQINTSDGVYDWNDLDDRLKNAQAHGVELLYTFGRTPQWASSRPDDRTCGYGPGQCAPPNDLQADGTGTDDHWKTFVAAIVKHAAGRIKYWEVWNEPYLLIFWTGTFEQLARLTRDASEIIRSIDGNAVILAPSADASGFRLSEREEWVRKYLGTGAGQYLDGISYHAYTQKPEQLINIIGDYKKLLVEYGMGSKPLWDTEGSWGLTTKVNEAERPGILARFLILQASMGIRQVYWYSWNKDVGTLSDDADNVLPGGTAYQQVHDWLAGTAFGAPCGESDNIWTCEIIKNYGQHHERIVWYSGGGTKRYRTDYINVRDIAGHAALVIGGSTEISSAPVLLENTESKGPSNR